MNFSVGDVRLYQRTLTDDSKSRSDLVTNDFRIVYIRKGSAAWKIGPQIYKVEAGNIVLISNGYPRVLKHVDADTPLEMDALCLSPHFVLSSGFVRLFTDLLLVRSPVLAGKNDALAALFAQIRAESTHQPLHAPFVIAAIACVILAHVARAYHFSSDPSAVRPEMEAVIRYIDGHFCERLCLGELARMAGFSEAFFSKQFRKCTGLPYSQYLKNKRIAQAISQIEASDDTILSIALACGYDTMANFYKAFRSVTGKTPSHYKRSALP